MVWSAFCFRCRYKSFEKIVNRHTGEKACLFHKERARFVYPKSYTSLSCEMKQTFKKDKSQQEALLEEHDGLQEAQSHSAVKQSTSSFKFFVSMREKKMQG